MLLVIKSPYTEIALNGEGGSEVFDCLKKHFDLEVVSGGEAMPLPPETPGERLAAIRLKHELTQSELARKSGIAQAAISDYENGKRKLTRKAAGKLGKALEEPVKRFFPKH
ncbi:helix-turn-helix domain-containing protein [Victivallis sp. Marseille-Q1083]|uniref:helix-turn-helix domain-containing protein n=1 Tax=Victivallis sp. Marseille-Q1083 TaxID=2717288 RepID=UPI00158CB35B|nr:helix-turn-helix transcriptional regulator [Victivallis sp. Marseille-Q1083]